MGNVKIVIGSWGSYNACNSRSLGSKWLDLAEYITYDEILDELKEEGFELDGIDEELFIQDIEGIDDNNVSWDNMSPQELFEILDEADVLDNSYKYELMTAFIEVRSFEDFMLFVKDHGRFWDGNIIYHKGFDWSDYGEYLLDICGVKIPDHLKNYIDFESYGKDNDEYAEECQSGIIEIIE